MTVLHLELGENSYDIQIGNGLLGRCNEFFNLNRRVIVVTDSGVPAEYARTVASGAKEARIVTVPMGEGSKSIEGLSTVLTAMSEFDMKRGDCAVAVGGGVVGDLTGFAAACYMRGIDFYNVPTTLLSQVDSSIGGKTAINFGGIKNIVGAFHQPRGVIVDTDVLVTLPERQIASGLAESVKMSLTSDKELFEKFERMSYEGIKAEIESIITASLMIKKSVVEQDERESGLRKILNFGHTFGHGVEAEEEMHGLYHGECVAIGMLPMCSDSVRARLAPVLEKLSLPTKFSGNLESALGFMLHDKKSAERGIDAVLVDEVGSCRIERMSTNALSDRIREWVVCK
ncbi:MAG: 3-dehydroquinate synthase [Clostridia bacterium]|nr:3-dehydroquinate synthase [Clostridia bacterium]